MVELNYGRRRPLDVCRCAGSPGCGTGTSNTRRDGARPRGAGRGVTYTTLLGRRAWPRLLPALAQAARTVGSPQIRNAGTIGGNLVTASPAGDTLPVLVALEATVELASARHGARRLPVSEFLTGPKQTALAPGELMVAVRVPVRPGRSSSSRSGCATPWSSRWRTGAGGRPGGRAPRWPGLGRARPHRDEAEGVGHDPARLGRRCRPRRRCEVRPAHGGRRRPIDDHRATAAYRRHAVGVMARRALERAWRPGGVSTETVEPTCEDRERRASPGGRRTWATACCTSCGTGSACRAPRTPASRASAARARCWSTACWCAPASSWPRPRWGAPSPPSRA